MEFSLSALPDLNGQKILVTGAAGLLGGELAALLALRGAAIAVHARTAAAAATGVQRVQQLISQYQTAAAINTAPVPTAPVPTASVPTAPVLNTVDTAALTASAAAAAPLLTPVAAQLTDPQQVRELVTTAAAQLGGLTGIVHAAAAQPVSSLRELSVAEWQSVLHSNVSSAHYLTQAAAQLLPAGGWVTMISSIEAQRPAAGHSHYATSKAALEMYTRAAALELGQQLIRVNAVAPGLVERPDIARQWPEGVASWRRHAPLGRLVTGADVAAACAFFASPAAGAVTGQVLAVDCGMLTTPGW